jgi:hypothetical protein
MEARYRLKKCDQMDSALRFTALVMISAGQNPNFVIKNLIDEAMFLINAS